MWADPPCRRAVSHGASKHTQHVLLSDSAWCDGDALAAAWATWPPSRSATPHWLWLDACPAGPCAGGTPPPATALSWPHISHAE